MGVVRRMARGRRGRGIGRGLRYAVQVGVRFTGNWDRALELSERAQAAVREVLQSEAEELADQMRSGLASGSPAGTALAPLHPLTAAMKGSQVPLAGMEKWVVSVEVGKFRWFVGIRDPEGVRIGTVHEEGRSWTQVWSERQRRWFFAQMYRFGLLSPGGSRAHPPPAGPTHGHVVPARPFVRPVAEAYLPGARARVGEAVRRAVFG